MYIIIVCFACGVEKAKRSFIRFTVVHTLESQLSSTNRHIVSTSLNLFVVYFTLLPLKLNWISILFTNHYYYYSYRFMSYAKCVYSVADFICVLRVFFALPCNILFKCYVLQ